LWYSEYPETKVFKVFSEPFRYSNCSTTPTVLQIPLGVPLEYLPPEVLREEIP